MTAGFWEAPPPEVELSPFVVIPMCEVPAGKMPTTAAGLVRRALAAGMRVWSTYAMALVPGVRRKSAETDEDGKRRFIEITLTLETVAVRFWLADESRRGWATWHNGSFEQAYVRVRGQGRWRVGADDLKLWIDEAKISV